MKRRALLIAGLGVTVSSLASAQVAARQRRVAVLSNYAEKDPLTAAAKEAFEGGLKDLGWVVGRNLRIDYRWGGSEVSRHPRYAQELLALEPELIVVGGGTNLVRVAQAATATVPIVFTLATDPVGGGLVASLARPGGNITGLSQREFGLGGKSLELLKQIVPGMTRAAVLRDPTTTGGTGQFGAIQSVAASLRMDVAPVDVRTASAIEQGLGAFARSAGAGMIVTTTSHARTHRKLLIRLAQEHRLAAIYPYSFIVEEGGLCSYGVDEIAAYHNVGVYVDRILKGEKAGDLPVQQPTKFELVLNLKTARAIDLRVPQSVLLRADRVIE